MTQGKYARCDIHGCRRKVKSDGLCPNHLHQRSYRIREANPALTGFIDDRLRQWGLID